MTRTEFEHIAAQLRQRVLKVGLDFFGNQEDAEDAAQETVVQLWRYCEHIDAERNVEALAVKMAKNCCISMYRKRHHAESGDEVFDSLQNHASTSVDSDPQAQLEAEDMQRMLDAAMARLNPRERQLFEMRHAEDLSTDEIAQQTGIPKASVAAMVSTARRKVIIALRIILSTAATYLVGLFLWLQQEPEAPVETVAKEHHTEEVNIPCKEGTLMEQAQCYLEQKRNQPKTYSIIKKLLYENQQ